MPLNTAQPPNYLLKVTLVKTTNPAVTRLISIPADLQFDELHLTIAAAFGWDKTCFSWVFRMWSEDPLKYSENARVQSNVAIYCTSDGFDAAIEPSKLGTQSSVTDKSKPAGLGRFWTYDFNISRFHHAIEVVDVVNDEHKGKIGLIGGQGQIERKAWQFADLTSVDGVKVAAKSIWDLDMGQVNARLKVVQEQVYEKRKNDAASQNMSKKKPGPKPKPLVNTAVKAATTKSGATAPATASKVPAPSASKVAAPQKPTPVKPTPKQTAPAKTPPIKDGSTSKKATPAKSPPTKQEPKIPTAAPIPNNPKPSKAGNPSPPNVSDTTMPSKAGNPSPPDASKTTPPASKAIVPPLLKTPIPSPLTPPQSIPIKQQPSTPSPSKKRSLPTTDLQAAKKAKVVKSETSPKKVVKREGGEKQKGKDVVLVVD